MTSLNSVFQLCTVVVCALFTYQLQLGANASDIMKASTNKHLPRLQISKPSIRIENKEEDSGEEAGHGSRWRGRARRELENEELDRILDLKSSDEEDITKRKWAGSNMAVWGKRDVISDIDDDSLDGEKRKWSGGDMAVWGKRDVIDDKKRKWSGGNMAVWGKRDVINDQHSNEEKRKWSGGNMAVWGKRKWSSGNMAVWGKRNKNNPISKENNEDSGEFDVSAEKRKWMGNNMAVWG